VKEEENEDSDTRSEGLFSRGSNTRRAEVSLRDNRRTLAQTTSPKKNNIKLNGTIADNEEPQQMREVRTKAEI
jgi:hypothetical protein